MNPTIKLCPDELHEIITNVERAFLDGEIDREERDELIKEAISQTLTGTAVRNTMPYES